MDSLTQIVLGAAVGEAALGKKVGNKALLYGAIAGTIPDLDVIVGSFTDTITAIEWHRGFSHSIVFCVLLAPILGFLVNKLERRLNVGWKPWTKLFFLSLITHPMLDAFTTWGTQLLWPFDARTALNSIFVIDPLYTIPFLIFTVAVLFQQKGSKRRLKLNSLGLTISTCYLLSTVLIKLMVEAKVEKELNEQEINYVQFSTRPAPFNTILWNANIDTPENYLIGDYSFFDTKPMNFEVFPKDRLSSNYMLEYPNVKRLIKISEGWYLMNRDEGHWYFNDLRFGLIPQKSGNAKFSFSYQLEIENREIVANDVPKSGADVKYLMENLWSRVKGN